jgi:hypothetical protein
VERLNQQLQRQHQRRKKVMNSKRSQLNGNLWDIK